MLRNKKLFIFLITTFFVLTGLYFLNSKGLVKKTTDELSSNGRENILDSFNPLSIDVLKNGDFPGSDIVIEETLQPGSNYNRYIGSYKSEDFKIYALLTVPTAKKPEGGFPVIIFNHGYIAPSEHVTTERYIAYIDAFARAGYIVFKSDYRGHGESEGDPMGAYGSNSYTVDVLNAVSSIKKVKDPSTGSGSIANADRIGMWGHSMGGFITLRSMVTKKDIKAGVIWGGVVGSYPDLLTSWRRGNGTPRPSPTGARGWRSSLAQAFGSLESNPAFWDSISATSYLPDISGPVQLHHGEADESVPVEFSKSLYERLKEKGKEVELFVYPGDNHNISGSFSLAMRRSVEFFDKHLK